MKIEMKFIGTEHLPTYYQLLCDMHTDVDKKNVLDHFHRNLDTHDHWGVFANGQLVGFISGTGINKDVYAFKDMYIKPNYRLQTKKFVEFAEEMVKVGGYSMWLSSAITSEGKKLLTKLGDGNISALVDLIGEN